MTALTARKDYSSCPVGIFVYTDTISSFGEHTGRVDDGLQTREVGSRIINTVTPFFLVRAEAFNSIGPEKRRFK